MGEEGEVGKELISVMEMIAWTPFGIACVADIPKSH